MKIKIIIISMIIALAVYVFSGSIKTYAANSTTSFQTIVQKLAQKFGLKESDIQSVYDEAQQERQSQMQSQYEEYLNQLVTDGKINQSQKQLLLAKYKELQEKKQQQISQWESQRQELLKWANDNDVDIEYLRGGFGGYRMGWGAKGMGFMH